MRIVIVSDLHANAEALQVLPRDYDELWILGDLVNYGPSPVEAVDFARANASLIVRGNHDHSAGFGKDPRCSDPFRAMAQATGRFTASLLTEDRKQFLRDLPTQAERKVDGVRFLACHALPSNPLYEYCMADSDRWREEVADIPADILLTGHTHVPFQRKIGSKLIVNPGSLGQPKHGRAEACYAVWDGRSVQLCAAPYDVDETVRKIQALSLPANIEQDLASVLRTGALPKLTGRVAGAAGSSCDQYDPWQ
jgi:protein phosphatase